MYDKLQVPKRSYTPFTEPLLYSPIIVSLRNKIKHSEKELIKLQKRLQQQSRKYEKPLTAGGCRMFAYGYHHGNLTLIYYVFVSSLLVYTLSV